MRDHTRVFLPAALATALLVGDAYAAGRVPLHAPLVLWLALAAAAALGGLLTVTALLAARSAMRRERVMQLAGRQLDELLQASRSEEESKRLLIGHSERILPGSGTGILIVAEGGERLSTALAETVDHTPLRAIRTAGLTARACLAMRLGHGHRRGREDFVLSPCEVCGAIAGSISCEPLVSGSDIIGAVLVGHERPISERQRAALRDSARRAAPILATQRELAQAEERSFTDALTGLPNRRAAESTLKRMVSHAGRSLSPLGLILLDFDRFRVLNELHGHTHGDRALASMGRLLSATIRASDFAARFGGEEFLLLLPDTDRRGSVEVAEKLRRQIERTELVQTGPLTASFGVSSLPEDAIDPDELIRRADRALYMAKAQGRNRVQAADPTGV
jgi:diguanylate cyclase (GGDEF)-like protein